MSNFNAFNKRRIIKDTTEIKLKAQANNLGDNWKVVSDIQYVHGISKPYQVLIEYCG